MAKLPVTKATFDPKNKTFKQRRDAMIKDAMATHKVKVSITSGGRTAEKAQKWHVGHMFLHNAFKSLKPAAAKAKSDPIPWNHFSSPTVKWKTVTFETFLRCKDGTKPVKDAKGKGWKTGKEPDEAATKKEVLRVLTADSVGPVGDRGSTMVAPGIEGCGEPCKCGGSRSKHISGKAADLGGLNTLAAKLRVLKPAKTLDSYLKEFGLHRPLLKAKKPEEWHVESI